MQHVIFRDWTGKSTLSKRRKDNVCSLIKRTTRGKGTSSALGTLALKILWFDPNAVALSNIRKM